MHETSLMRQQLLISLSLYRILYVNIVILAKASPAPGWLLFLSGCKHSRRRWTNCRTETEAAEAALELAAADSSCNCWKKLSKTASSVWRNNSATSCCN